MSTKINNLKFAVNNTDSAKAVLDPQYEAQALALIEQFKERIEKFDDEFVSLLSFEEQAQIMKWKAGAELWITKLNAFLETSKWPGGADSFDEFDFYNTLPTLEGNQWHGDITYASDTNAEELWSEYSTKCDGLMLDGTFTDVISVAKAPVNLDAGTLGDSAIGFVLDDTVEKIYGKTGGDDIWITITYRDGKPAKIYCLKDLAVRDDVQIYFYGGQNKESFVADFSDVIRVANGKNNLEFGSVENGIWVFGGAGNDLIIGSASNDHLVGGYGDDRIFGMGGWDDINGDSYYADPSLANGEGGNDYIDGGTGYDTVHGGGGAMDVAIEDPNWSNEFMGEVETPDGKRNFGTVNKEELIPDHDGWEVSDMNPDTGEFVVSSSEKNGEITIRAPKGYTMCSARNDGNDIVITLVKFDEDMAEPEYIQVRLKGVNADGNQTDINFMADKGVAAWETTITDWHDVYSAGNTVKFIGTGGASDTFIGPYSNLDKLNIDTKGLEDGSTVGKDKLEELVKPNEAGDCTWGLSGGAAWDSAEIINDEIVLDAGNKEGLDIELNLPADFDFDGAFYKVDENGETILYIIDVLDEKAGTYDLITVRIVGNNNMGVVGTLKVNGSDAELMGTTYYYTGEGSDLVVASKGSTSQDSDESKDDSFYFGNFGTDWKDNVPVNSDDVDSDGDGYSDWVEEQLKTDPNDKLNTPKDPDKFTEEPKEPGDE